MADPPTKDEGPVPAKSTPPDRGVLAAVAAAVAVLYPGCRLNRIEVEDEP
jgi:hypothetical protein